MTLVWYPWTEGAGGLAGTQGAFKTLDLGVKGVAWPRLPNAGETIFFDDGGAAAIEAVGWKLDGTPYLYLGKRYKKKGDQLQAWLSRGFKERAAAPVTQASEPTAPTPAATANGGAEPPTMPGQPAGS